MEAGGRARCPALLLLLLAAALGGEAEAEEPRPARQRGDEQCHYYAGGQVYPGEAARLPVSDHSLHLSQAKSRWRARPGLRSGGAGAGMCPQCARGCGAGRRRRQRHVRRSAGSRALPFPQPCLPSALPSPRRSAGPAGRARQPGERQGERRGRRAPAAPSRPPFVSCSPPPSHGLPRGPRFQKWRTSSGKRFTGCPGMLCACSAPETMNGLLS